MELNEKVSSKEDFVKVLEKNEILDKDKLENNNNADNKKNELNNVSTLELSIIKDKWLDIINKINDINSKTAIFLEDLVLEKVSNNIIYILVKNANAFKINSLNKDKNLIEESINKVLNTELKLEMSFVVKENNEDNGKNKQKNKADKDHPLFMDVLEKFKGQIIK